MIAHHQQAVEMSDLLLEKDDVAPNVAALDNGFLGLRLPREIDAELTIECDGLSSATPISSSSDDPTCLTTAYLS
jgi:uncharacterized protein (DUF305 family)